MNKTTFTATPACDAPSLEEQIRRIVREELAAHKERRDEPVYLSDGHEKMCAIGISKPL